LENKQTTAAKKTLANSTYNTIVIGHANIRHQTWTVKSPTQCPQMASNVNCLTVCCMLRNLR